MKINRELRSKYTCDMASHPYKMKGVEKTFLGDTEVYLLQKIIFGPYQLNSSQ